MVVVAGLALAFTTAILYAAAVGLQALEAREAPQEQHLRLSLLRRLITKPRWLIGTGLALLGWAAQVGALLLIPLTLVEPALAMSLVVLLVIGSRVLGERVGRREILSVSAMVAGIALLAWAAPPRETDHASGAGVHRRHCHSGRDRPRPVRPVGARPLRRPADRGGSRSRLRDRRIGDEVLLGQSFERGLDRADRMGSRDGAGRGPGDAE